MACNADPSLQARGEPHPTLHVAITGASSGIGAELATVFADKRTRLSLIARRRGELSVTGARCRDRGAMVDLQTCDVADASAVARWFATADAAVPVDILIVNAGIFDGHGADARLETPEETQRLIAVNLAGAIYTAQAALPQMMARRAGHIAFVSSLAGRVPLADAPTYSATKAGLVAYAAALRELLLPYGIAVTTVLPGHVQTAQTDIHVGPTPMIISASAAASIIKRGLTRRQAVIAFPTSAVLATRLSALLPWKLRAWLAKPSRFHCRKPLLEDAAAPSNPTPILDGQ